jgi:hypothetical protein
LQYLETDSNKANNHNWFGVILLHVQHDIN